MPTTSTRQRNAVSEGIALGLMLCGRTELPSAKFAIDTSFVGAFNAWSYNDGRFRQVQSDISKGLDGSNAMLRADEGKQTFAFYWVRAGAHVRVSARAADWSVDDPDDVKFALSVIDGDVPQEGWQALAEDFLRRLDR